MPAALAGEEVPNELQALKRLAAEQKTVEMYMYVALVCFAEPVKGDDFHLYLDSLRQAAAREASDGIRGMYHYMKFFATDTAGQEALFAGGCDALEQSVRCWERAEQLYRRAVLSTDTVLQVSAQAEAAYIYEQTNRPGKGCELYKAAAETALRGNAPASAIRYFRKAGDCLLTLQQYDGALSLAAEAMRHAQ